MDTGFADMPLRMEGDSFACAHAELALPGRFSYLYEPNDCISSFDATKQNILFVGHTHMQTKFTWSQGRLLQGKNEDFQLKEGDRYLVNAGSVGDPRDGLTKAHYIIYDEEKKNLKYRSIPFDIQSFKINLAKAKLPVTPFFVMIDEGHRKEAETIKDMEVMSDNQVSSSDTEITIFDKEEMLETRTRRLTRSINFSPEIMEKIQTHKRKIEEQRTKGFETKKKKSKAPLIIIILLLIIAAIAAILLLLNNDPKPKNVSTQSAVTIENDSIELFNDKKQNLNSTETNSKTSSPPTPSAGNNLLSYDGMSYQSRRLSGKDKGSFGWDGKWTQSGLNISKLVSGSLKVKGSTRKLKTSGDYIQVSGSTFDFRKLDVSESGPYGKLGYIHSSGKVSNKNKTIYISFLMKVESSSGSFALGFNKKGRKVKTPQWGITKAADGKKLALNAVGKVYPIQNFSSEAQFFVIRIDFLAGADDIFIYVDPNLNSEPKEATLNVYDAGALGFDSVELKTRDGASISIDEIRIGTSYKSVTPQK